MAFWVLPRAELGSHGIVIKCKAAIFFCAVDYSSYKCVFSATTRAPISQFQVSYCTVMVIGQCTQQARVFGPRVHGLRAPRLDNK